MSDADWAKLDAALLTAHAGEDSDALIGLYVRAAEMARTAGALERAAFFLTHAYVYALERGDARTEDFHARLVRWGRDV